jgi:hypothetical protein
VTYRVLLNGQKEVTGRTYRDIVRALMGLEMREGDGDIDAYMVRAAERFSALRPGKAIRTASPEEFVTDLESAGLLERLA